MFDPTTLVGFHTWVSLVAIAAGIAAVAGLIRGGNPGVATAAFLVGAVVTDVTGYMVPATQLLPSHIVGAMSLFVLLGVLVARYKFRLAGPWRWFYAAGMVAALYFLVFVGIVQAFLKVPVLHALAPTGAEPAFAAVQLAALVMFVVLGVKAARAFRP